MPAAAPDYLFALYPLDPRKDAATFNLTRPVAKAWTQFKSTQRPLLALRWQTTRGRWSLGLESRSSARRLVIGGCFAHPDLLRRAHRCYLNTLAQMSGPVTPDFGHTAMALPLPSMATRGTEELPPAAALSIRSAPAQPEPVA